METRGHSSERLDPRALRGTLSKSQRLSLEPRRPSAALAVGSCVARLRSQGSAPGLTLTVITAPPQSFLGLPCLQVLTGPRSLQPLRPLPPPSPPFRGCGCSPQATSPCSRLSLRWSGHLDAHAGVFYPPASFSWSPTFPPALRGQERDAQGPWSHPHLSPGKLPLLWAPSIPLLPFLGRPPPPGSVSSGPS